MLQSFVVFKFRVAVAITAIIKVFALWGSVIASMEL